MKRQHRISLAAAVVSLAGLVTVPVGSMPAAAATPVASSPAGGFAQPGAQLGSGWAASADQAVVGVGDSAGFHLMIAKEDKAFRWANLVTLSVPGIDEGPWTGEVCTTGDGRYAVAVYAPSAAVNRPSLIEAGAFAAVVDLATGKTTAVAAGVQLAYHTPSCGVGDQAVLTRALGSDEQQTQILDVAAAAAAVTAVRTVKAQVTNVVPTATGDYGVVGSGLARINPDGSYAPVAALPGAVFGAVPTAAGIDLLTAQDGRGVLSRWDGRTLHALGSGELGHIRLYQQANGGDAVLGDVSGIAAGARSPRIIARATLPYTLSRSGDLYVDSAGSAELDAIVHGPVGANAPAQTEGQINVTVTAAHSGAKLSGRMTADGPEFLDLAPDQVKTVPVPRQPVTTASEHLATVENGAGAVVKTAESKLGATSLLIRPASYQPGAPNPTADDDWEDDVDLSTVVDAGSPTCLVPRNSSTDQVLQPNPFMIEWAVDQAAHNRLTLTRPANYLQTGQASYSPQTMFPAPALSGGGTIPAQVLLGILAQESNFQQASPHARPGDSGNPLISDYYGTAHNSLIADNPDVVPDYAHTDCGYGVGQVTDGMSTLNGSAQLSTAKATAVATDYAANIAAAAQILAGTWNQLYQQGTTENNGSTQYIENWFGAIWAYNSGVHLQSDAPSNNGNYGLGWLNNPANPNYPADREPFADNKTPEAGGNDAAAPQYWPYEEKVMGWITHPQQYSYAPPGYDYIQPTWGSTTDVYTAGKTENIPENTVKGNGGFFTFCGAQNACTPNAASPCPADNSSCWWHGPVTWITGTESVSNATTEALNYTLGSAEPAIQPQYASDCPSESAFRGQFAAGTYIVNTLANPAQNTRGCAWSAQNDGKFTLRLGDNISIGTNGVGLMQSNPLSAQIDLHQIGGGFLGHFYFTHAYDGTSIATASDGCIAFSGSDGSLYCTQTATPTKAPVRIQNKVLATWTPNFQPATTGYYLILAAIPGNGAAASGLGYKIDTGVNTSTGAVYPSATCTINQGSGSGNRWVELGTYSLSYGSDVRVSNMVAGASNSGAASNDVAFSSMIFEPVASPSAGSCGTTLSLSVN